MIKKQALIVLLLFLSISVVCAANNDSDTTKIKNKKYNIHLWLRQPTNILGFSGVEGSYETNEKGFYFFPRKESYKNSYHIAYGYTFQDIVIDWKDIAIIKRRSVSILVPFLRNSLFIKLKDGKHYYFLCNHKKEIIKAYKTYMNVIGK